MEELPFSLSSVEKEGRFNVSKWIRHPLFLDEAEIKDLLSNMGPFFIAPAGGAVGREELLISREKFMAVYAAYIASLKKGELSDEGALRRFFSCYLTRQREALYITQAGADKYIIRPRRPVIQLQMHHFYASSIDGKFHSMVLSRDSVSWGLQFSYPQVFEDPITHVFSKVTSTEEFPNTDLFKSLVTWMRASTLPTPFVFNGVLTRVPFRLGRNCFSWISKHPGLQSKGISVQPL